MHIKTGYLREFLTVVHRPNDQCGRSIYSFHPFIQLIALFIIAAKQKGCQISAHRILPQTNELFSKSFDLFLAQIQRRRSFDLIVHNNQYVVCFSRKLVTMFSLLAAQYAR